MISISLQCDIQTEDVRQFLVGTSNSEVMCMNYNMRKKSNFLDPNARKSLQTSQYHQ